MLITQISNQFLLWYFQRPFFCCRQLNLLTFQKLRSTRRSKQQKTSTQSKHWNTGIYRGSEDRSRYYYNRKGLVYNVHSANSPYSYGELSIFVPFFIARGTCWGNEFLFLSFVRLKSHISTFITIFEYVLSFKFQSKYFEAVKGYHTFCIENLKQRTTLNFLFVTH